MDVKYKETEEIGKITIEDKTAQKAILLISGKGSEMTSVNVEFEPEITDYTTSIAANLALQFITFLADK